MKHYASLWNYLVILLSLVLVKLIRWYRDTVSHYWRIYWRVGGGWGNNFPTKKSSCLILKEFHAQPNRFGSHIFLLSLWSNRNNYELLFVIIYVDVVFCPDGAQHIIIYCQSRLEKKRVIVYLIPFL